MKAESGLRHLPELARLIGAKWRCANSKIPSWKWNWRHSALLAREWREFLPSQLGIAQMEQAGKRSFLKKKTVLETVSELGKGKLINAK